MNSHALSRLSISFVCGVAFLSAAAPTHAQSRTATVTFASQSAGSGNGYANASVDVRYVLLSCPGGAITIAASRLRGSVQASDTYVYEGDPVRATQPAPAAPPVRFAGNVLHGGRVIGSFDMQAGDALGLGCFTGETQVVGQLGAHLGSDRTEQSVQSFLNSLSITVRSDPSPLGNSAIENAVRAERTRARRAAEAAERERQAEERRRAEEARRAEARRAEERRAEERRANEARVAEERRRASERAGSRESGGRAASGTGPAQRAAGSTSGVLNDERASEFSLREMAAWMSTTVRRSGFTPQQGPDIDNRLGWDQAGCQVTYSSYISGRGGRGEIHMRMDLADITSVTSGPDGTGAYHVTMNTPGTRLQMLVRAWEGSRQVHSSSRPYTSASMHFPSRADAERAAELLRRGAAECR